MPNGNRFYVHPGSDIAPGLRGLAQSIGQEKEKRAKKKKSQEAMEVLRSGDPDRIAEFSAANPEFAKSILGAANFKNEGTKQNYINSLRQGLLNPDKIPEITANRQEYLKTQGVTKAESIHTDAIVEKYNQDQEGTIKQLETEFALIAEPSQWKQYRESTNAGEGETTPATDIDDFVADADAESIRLTGKKLTPGERNKARLQMKRAQAGETAANTFAKRHAEEVTAKKIAFNEMTGKRLAEIETAGALLKAKGEVSPQAKIDKAKGRMSGNLATLANHYITLDSTGAILNVDNNTFDNVIAAMRASTVGQQFGRITGTNEQSIRNSIKKLKPLLIQDIRQSTDMGARGLDSEKELEFYLQAATDEKTDIQSNIAAIVVLDEAFGEGKIAEKLRALTDQSLIKRISDKGFNILHGGKADDKPLSELTEEEIFKKAFGAY